MRFALFTCVLFFGSSNSSSTTEDEILESSILKMAGGSSTNLIGYVGIGYDLLEANPEGDFKRGGIDPGFKGARNIFKSTYTETKSVTFEGAVVDLPDQMNYQPMHGCSLVESVYTYSGTRSYQKKLSLNLKASLGGSYGLAEFAFSLSAGYQHAQSATATKKQVMLEKSVICNVGTIRYLFATALTRGYPLSTDFYSAVKNLPATYKQPEYIAFIKNWGTHFLESVVLGGRTTYRYIASYSELAQYAQTHVQGSVSASGSYSGFSGSVDVSIDLFNQASTHSTTFGSHTSTVTTGSAIEKVGNAWRIKASNTDIPIPIHMTIRSITEAFDPRLWVALPGGNSYTSLKIGDKLNHLKTALRAYPTVRHARLASDPSIRMPNAWPDGTYSLPMSESFWLTMRGRLRHISVSSRFVWGVSHYDTSIWKCARPCKGQWVHVPGGLVQLDTDESEVWGVASDKTIWRRPIDGSRWWTRVKGGLVHVSASGNGFVWGTASDYSIWYCQKPCHTGAWRRKSGGLAQLDAGTQYVYGVSTGSLYRAPVNGGGNWQKIPTPRPMTYIATGSTIILGVGTDGYPYTCRIPCTSGNWNGPLTYPTVPTRIYMYRADLDRRDHVYSTSTQHFIFHNADVTRSSNGCPYSGDQFPWYTGYRHQDNENDGNHNDCQVKGLTSDCGSDLTVSYCSKVTTQRDYGIKWPEGSYCILRKQGTCPTGLTSGSVTWDDENSHNRNSVSGMLPDGMYNYDTTIYYCCRNDRHPFHNEIMLPTEKPFFLIRNHVDGCQHVKSKRVYVGYIRTDDENTNNHNTHQGSVPYGVGHYDQYIGYCYYY